MTIKRLRNPVAAFLAGALFTLAVFLLPTGTIAFADDDDHVHTNDAADRWVFECGDTVNGCTQGGILYHTQAGPGENVYFIAHYTDSGNVYARRVEFR